MTHSAAVLPAFAVPFLTLSLVHAAEMPARPEPVLYFPTTVGTKWVYWDGAHEVTKLVSKVETKEDEKIVSVVEVRPGGRKIPVEKVTVAGAGLARIELGGHKFDAPLRLLKFPLKPGDTWELRTTHSSRTDDTGTATVHDHEEVKVPAGRFKTVRMVYEFSHEGVPQRTTLWFAPGVGLIKLETVDDAKQVLKSFVVGKG